MKNIKSRKDEGLLFVFLPWTAASNPCGKANLRGLKKEKKKKYMKWHQLLSLDLALLQGLSELRLIGMYGIQETVGTFSWL